MFAPSENWLRIPAIYNGNPQFLLVEIKVIKGLIAALTLLYQANKQIQPNTSLGVFITGITVVLFIIIINNLIVTNGMKVMLLESMVHAKNNLL